MRLREAIPLLLAAALVAVVLWQGRPDVPRSGSRQLAGIGAASSMPPATTTPSAPAEVPYVEVVDSCNYAYLGACVNLRSGPATSYPVMMKLRTGIVLQVKETVTRDARTWYELLPDEEVRFPERVTSDWYVAADVVHLFYSDGNHDLAPKQEVAPHKRIVVHLATQTLQAYDGDALFLETPISTGLNLTPTPVGKFRVYRMAPSRYMQGPLPGVSDQYYDLPGVPWNLYFTTDGAVIHGAYWHNSFGRPWSHGCVNVPLDIAKKLYDWAELGTAVEVLAT